MTETAATQLESLRGIVELAKSVPMSASCMVNRAEALSLIDGALTTVRSQEEAARRESGADAIADAHAQADQIIADALAEAERLKSADEVHAKAVEAASELADRAETEATSLKREADVYVDQRMAELEAYMTKTLTQLKTMRARLSERSGLDDPES